MVISGHPHQKARPLPQAHLMPEQVVRLTGDAPACDHLGRESRIAQKRHNPLDPGLLARGALGVHGAAGSSPIS